MSCYRTCSHCGAHIGLGSAGRAGPSPPLVFLEQRAQGDRREEYHFPLRRRIPPSTSASSLRRAADTTRPPAHTHIPLNGFYPPFSKNRSIGKSSPLRSLSPHCSRSEGGGRHKRRPGSTQPPGPIGRALLVKSPPVKGPARIPRPTSLKMRRRSPGLSSLSI